METALDISSSAFRKDKTIVQKKVKPNKQSQEWVYDQGYICSKEYPTLVLDIRGDSEKGGAQILLYKRKDSDNLNQLWHFEPYGQFEHTLNMATTSLPLHKKEGFGQPRPGYGAEVGVPEELKKLPEDIKVAGVGNNVTPTPTTNAPDNSRNDPALAQYGSFYGEANFQMPSAGVAAPPKPINSGPAPLSHNDNAHSGPPSYPPPAGYPQPAPSTSSSSYPPNINQPYPQSASSTSSSNYQPNVNQPYPQPSTSSGFPEPYPNSPGPQGQSGSAGYPAPPSFTPGYPSSNPATSGDFPHVPPSPSNYMNPPSGYPPSNPGYPYPPSNTGAGYPPAPGYPPSSNYPPPAPNYGRPQQDQHAYPPYPQ
ncbi:hypothetical protein G6F62_002262 [Rhizopus arrhizus]|nr:hypothetical protein G6F62_002262 [Rhizopus arrhizus]